MRQAPKSCNTAREMPTLRQARERAIAGYPPSPPQGDHPNNWRQPTQEPSNLKSSAKFPSGRGHHVPAPTWDGCWATISNLLSCSGVPAGGCRSSGWALVLLALACGCGVVLWLFCFLCEGADLRTGLFHAGIPSMFWDFGSLHQKPQVGGPLGSVRRDGSDGWRSPVPRGDITGGGEVAYLLRQPSLLGRRPVQSFVMNRGRCTS